MKHWILGEKAPFSKNMPLGLLFLVCLFACLFFVMVFFFCVTVYLTYNCKMTKRRPSLIADHMSLRVLEILNNSVQQETL